MTIVSERAPASGPSFGRTSMPTSRRLIAPLMVDPPGPLAAAASPPMRLVVVIPEVASLIATRASTTVAPLPTISRAPRITTSRAQSGSRRRRRGGAESMGATVATVAVRKMAAR